jgi:hypothetical protein
MAARGVANGFLHTCTLVVRLLAGPGHNAILCDAGRVLCPMDDQTVIRHTPLQNRPPISASSSIGGDLIGRQMTASQGDDPPTLMRPSIYVWSREACAIASARSSAAESLADTVSSGRIAICYCLLRFANRMSTKPNRDESADTTGP